MIFHSKMTDDDLTEDIRVEWTDFLSKFHENHPIAQQSMKKVNSNDFIFSSHWRIFRSIFFQRKTKFVSFCTKRFFRTNVNFWSIRWKKSVKRLKSTFSFSFRMFRFSQTFLRQKLSNKFTVKFEMVEIFRVQFHSERKFIKKNWPKNFFFEFDVKKNVSVWKLSRCFYSDFLPERWPGENNTSHWELININERIRICKSDETNIFWCFFSTKIFEFSSDTNRVNSLRRISTEFSNVRSKNKVNWRSWPI